MRYAPLLLLAMLVSCGGSSSEPLLSGSVTGTYDTTSFTVKDGVYGSIKNGSSESNVIALSSDDFNCDSLSADEPPKGDYAAIDVTTLAVGSYSNVDVTMFENNGSFNGVGSGTATLEITDITDSSVSATITYSDTIDGKSYQLSGSFQVQRCP